MDRTRKDGTERPSAWWRRGGVVEETSAEGRRDRRTDEGAREAAARDGAPDRQDGQQALPAGRQKLQSVSELEPLDYDDEDSEVMCNPEVQAHIKAEHAKRIALLKKLVDD